MRKYLARELLAEIDSVISFDDILLVPSYSNVKSRMDPDISIFLSKEFELTLPMISSPMDTITESVMAASMANAGGLGVIHRFIGKEEQRNNAITCYDSAGPNSVALAIGVGESERSRFDYLYREIGEMISWIVVDVANGHSEYTRDMVKRVLDESGGAINVMAGNVATKDGFAYLAEAGANSVRVGIGGGSICKTRIMTGFGVPTISSVLDCHSVVSEYPDVSIIADGGIRYPADVVKCLAAGANAVMVGGILSGTIECPGDVLIDDSGLEYKRYRGMASEEVQIDRRGGLKSGTCAEGVSTKVPLKGSVSDVLNEFLGGLRSALTYSNSKSISHLRDNARFVRITASSIEESHAFGTRI